MLPQFQQLQRVETTLPRTAGPVQALQGQQGTDITAVVPVNTAQMADEQCDLFAFINNSTTSAHLPISCVVDKIDKYLSSADTPLESLMAYPRFLKAFVKYNSFLTSSATVERLFSCAGQILVPRRCKVSDKKFDKLVFLRYKLKNAV